MSYITNDIDSNFSIFKKNFSNNNIKTQKAGSSAIRVEKNYNRDTLLHNYLDFYNNKFYTSKPKRIEAIKKDMKSLKKEKYRIYLDDNGNTENNPENILRVKDFLDGNVEKYDIIARNPELQHLGIDGFFEGYEINMGNIL